MDEPQVGRLKLFCGTPNPRLGQEIAAYLGIPPGQRMSTRFADGETYIRFEENARSEDTFVVHPTCPPVNEHLVADHDGRAAPSLRRAEHRRHSVLRLRAPDKTRAETRVLSFCHQSVAQFMCLGCTANPLSKSQALPEPVGVLKRIIKTAKAGHSRTTRSAPSPRASHLGPSPRQSRRTGQRPRPRRPWLLR